MFVRAVFDLHCEWEGLPPIYRIYVNDELFTERTWLWTDHYLEETLQISAAVGQYKVRVTPVGSNLARFHPTDWRVEYGPARWIKKGLLEIYDESPGIPA